MASVIANVAIRSSYDFLTDRTTIALILFSYLALGFGIFTCCYYEIAMALCKPCLIRQEMIVLSTTTTTTTAPPPAETQIPVYAQPTPEPQMETPTPTAPPQSENQVSNV